MKWILRAFMILVLSLPLKVAQADVTPDNWLDCPGCGALTPFGTGCTCKSKDIDNDCEGAKESPERAIQNGNVWVEKNGKRVSPEEAMKHVATMGCAEAIAAAKEYTGFGARDSSAGDGDVPQSEVGSRSGWSSESNGDRQSSGNQPLDPELQQQIDAMKADLEKMGSMTPAQKKEALDKSLADWKSEIRAREINAKIDAVQQVNAKAQADPSKSPGAIREEVLGSLGQQMGIGNPYDQENTWQDIAAKGANQLGVLLEAGINIASPLSAEYNTTTGKFTSPDFDSTGPAVEIANEILKDPPIGKATGKLLDAEGKLDAAKTAVEKSFNVWDQETMFQQHNRVIKLVQIEEGLKRWESSLLDQQGKHERAGDNAGVDRVNKTLDYIRSKQSQVSDALRGDDPVVVEVLRKTVRRRSF